MMQMPRSTQALLNLLNQRAAGPALDIGSHQGAVASALGCGYVHTDLTACFGAREAGVEPVLHTDLLPDGPFATICFDTSEYDPGLALETVAQAAARLAPGGFLITTARRADLEACFTFVTEHGEALMARLPREPLPESPTWPVYEAGFGGIAYRIQSAPGVFSPRGMDEGTRFMLTQIQAGPGARFLDLGCGTGLVSRIASETWGCKVTAVDVDARALRLAAANAPQAEVIASDGFNGLGGQQFDITASNPPYHADFAVGRAFIEGAYHNLATGGTLYLVVKRADWYVRKVRDIFGGCRLAEDAGYTVITSQKRAVKSRPAAPAPAPMTRKHAKRMAASQKKPRP